MNRSVLFVCNQNSVRSPMAAALLRSAQKSLKADSAGVYLGGLDPFVEMVMAEAGVELHDHEPKTLQDIDVKNFDVLIALTQEGAVALREAAPEAQIEYWETENPSHERGGRDAIVDAYRRVRDQLSEKLQKRFRDLQQKP